MMSDVDVHREQDFSARESSVGRVVDLIELVANEAGDYRGAVVEGLA